MPCLGLKPNWLSVVAKSGEMQAVAHAEIFWGGAKFCHKSCEINFRGSAEGTTILEESGGMLSGEYCKITPKNTHFCAFWKQDLA